MNPTKPNGLKHRICHLLFLAVIISLYITNFIENYYMVSLLLLLLRGQLLLYKRKIYGLTVIAFSTLCRSALSGYAVPRTSPFDSDR